MNPDDITDDWLRSANERYRASDIPPVRRPFQALSDLSRERNSTIRFPSPAAKKIFDWFKAHTKPGSHAVGAMYTGAFYFDACFWPVRVPMGYGQCHLNALDALETMPLVLKQELQSKSNDIWAYVLYWADCVDYAYGLNDIQKSNALNPRAQAFLQNADNELVGTIAQLTVDRPVSKAILSARMACEIFIKVLLVQEKGLTDQELKKLSHRISDLAKEAFAEVPLKEFQIVDQLSHLFPDVSERYDGKEKPLSAVWEALCVAQTAASAVIRHYSGRDIRSQVIGSKK